MKRWKDDGEKDDDEIEELQAEIREWRLVQFPNATLSGAGNHLVAEIFEAAEELADCFFLSSQCQDLGGVPVGMPEFCFQAIRGLGLNPAMVIRAKLAKNKRRKWPSEPDEGGIYEAED